MLHNGINSTHSQHRPNCNAKSIKNETWKKKKKNIADEWISDNTWGQQIHTTEQRISVTNSGFNQMGFCLNGQFDENREPTYSLADHYMNSVRAEKNFLHLYFLPSSLGHVCPPCLCHSWFKSRQSTEKACACIRMHLYVLSE